MKNELEINAMLLKKNAEKFGNAAEEISISCVANFLKNYNQY